MRDTDLAEAMVEVERLALVPHRRRFTVGYFMAGILGLGAGVLPQLLLPSALAMPLLAGTVVLAAALLRWARNLPGPLPAARAVRR